MSELSQAMLIFIGAPGIIVLGVVVAILVAQRKERSKQTKRTCDKEGSA